MSEAIREYVLIVRLFNWDKSVGIERVRCLAYDTADAMARFQLLRQIEVAASRQKLLDVQPYREGEPEHGGIDRFLADEDR